MTISRMANGSEAMCIQRTFVFFDVVLATDDEEDIGYYDGSKPMVM